MLRVLLWEGGGLRLGTKLWVLFGGGEGALVEFLTLVFVKENSVPADKKRKKIFYIFSYLK